jgi:anti-anti-sigma regulatory factor
MAARGRTTHQLGLMLGRSATVRLAGEIDVAAAADLSSLLDTLDMVVMPLGIDMAGVTFLDTHGIEPLMDAAVRRSEQKMGRVLIGERSPQAQFFLDVAELGGRPQLDVDAWGRLTIAGHARATHAERSSRFA